MQDFHSKLRDSYEETQNEKWYKSVGDHIIDLATGVYGGDKDLVQKQINAARGIVDIEDIKKELKVYNASEDNITFPSHINDLEFISGITERYMGEYIRQFTDFEVFNNDPEVVLRRNKELNGYLSNKIMELVFNLYKQKQAEAEQAEQQEQEAPPVSISEEEIKKIRKEFLDNWIDEKTVEYQHIVKLLDITTDADVKYIQGFFYWFATEQVYSYRRVIGDKVYKEVVSPLEYHRVRGNNIFVEDDPMGVRVTQVNLNTINIEHRKDMSDTDYTFLLELIDKGFKDGDYYVTPAMLNSRVIDGKTIEKAFDGRSELRFGTEGQINRYHIVFKKEEPIQILTYLGSDGNITEKEVSYDYELDPSIGDIDLKTDHILRVMDMYRFGTKAIGIYTKPKYVIPERNDVGNSSLVKLPYNGLTGILGDGVCNPIPMRIAPLQILTKFYTYQQQRSVSKYKNYLLLAEELLNDSEEMSRADRLDTAQKDGLLVINVDDSNANILQTLRSVSMTGMENYIASLSQLINELKQTAMGIASMNEQRYGDINTSAGKATTEYAITKATTASILLFEMYNKFRERDGLADIDASKIAWSDGMKGSYYDKQQKKIVYVDISGEDHNAANIGLYYKNGVMENEKKARLTEIAMSAAQNGELTLAAEAINADNMSSLIQLIRVVEAKKQESDRANTQYLEENKLKMADMSSKLEQAKMDTSIGINKYSEDMETARLELQIASTTYLTLITNDTDDGAIAMARLELDQKKHALNQLVAGNKILDNRAKLAQRQQQINQSKTSSKK